MKLGGFGGTALLLLLAPAAFGQASALLTTTQLAQAGPSQILFAAMVKGCGVADSLAKLDIEKQQPFLLLASGSAPVVQVPTDAAAEQKFQFHYYEYGCTSPDEACMLGYNQRVFAYLTSKYGRKWAKAVRSDVIGLKAWRRAQ